MSTTRTITGLAVGALTAMLVGSEATASPRCITVRGTYTEQIAAGPDCASPVGLCIDGEYRGSFRGPLSGAASALLPTADTPTTGVVLFTSDAVIDAQVRGLEGTLLTKNAGAFNTTGAGDIVDAQTIIGGTGDFTGATGGIRAEGTFTTEAGGRSSYTGTICVP
ncbi:MAG: hypothetical protein H0U21_05235 [Acidimicrobiia bacterium]|nr:hypothetical protein [Acidimicrobiia bacterium]